MASPARPVIDYDSLIEEYRIHGALYRDDAIFQEELERIWYREWVFVGHESEIPQSGDYATKRIGLQPLILCRDEGGEIQLLMNRCSHRSNTVCLLEHGNSHAFRCSYHGWTFTNKGALLGVPYRSQYGDSFRREERGLAHAPRLATYRGLIFGSLSPTGISLEEHLGDTRSLLDHFLDLSPSGEVEVRAGTQKMRFHGNWKMPIENALDGYHANFVHESNMSLLRRIGTRTTNYASEKSMAVGRIYEGGHVQLDFWPEIRRVGKRTLSGTADPMSGGATETYEAAMHARYGSERAKQLLLEGPPQLVIFPNLFIVQSEFRVMHPISARESAMYLHVAFLKGAPPEINTQRLRRHEHAYGPAGFVLTDDTEVFERNQEALDAQVSDWIVLDRGQGKDDTDSSGHPISHVTSELPIRAFWRHYKALMQRS